MSANTVMIGVRITEDQNRLLEEVCDRTFRKKSDLIRLGLALVFDREGIETGKEEGDETGN